MKDLDYILHGTQVSDIYSETARALFANPKMTSVWDRYCDAATEEAERAVLIELNATARAVTAGWEACRHEFAQCVALATGMSVEEAKYMLEPVPLFADTPKIEQVIYDAQTAGGWQRHCNARTDGNEAARKQALDDLREAFATLWAATKPPEQETRRSTRHGKSTMY